MTSAPMELLAPAGSPEALTAAVRSGADAVYLGCGDFNARRKARNFTEADLREAVAFCHIRGVRVYLTLNTLVTDRELPAALALAELANHIGVDAVLVQDVGLARLLRLTCPRLPLHASTQMTVHSLDGVLLCAEAGMERVVLSRELSREAIAHICAHSPVEIEVFAHGALCMCYSGQCFLSSVVGTRSGNRGLCAQPCRLPYSGGHPLSLKDMSLADHLRELRDMGVACVKLEGRMKRPEYVAVVTRIYADALREDRRPTPREQDDLLAAFSRSGFTQGYFLDQKGPRMFGTRDGAPDPEALYAAARAACEKETPRVPADFSLRIAAGRPIEARVRDDAGHTARAAGPVPQAALHRAVTGEEVEAQLAKTGGTPYLARSVRVELDPGLSVPRSVLNGLRRELLEELSRLRAQPPRREVLPLPAPTPCPPHREPPQLAFTLRAARQLTPRLWSLPHSRIDLPADQLAAHPDLVRAALAEGAVLSAALPRICWDRERQTLERTLDAVRALGVTHALVPTWDLLHAARRHGFTLHGDFGLGVCNSASLTRLKELGFASATLSFELRMAAIRDLQKPLPAEVIAYGRLPLMMLEQPPGGKPLTGGDALTDRREVSFPVLPAPGGRAELLNAQPLWLADKPGWDSLGLSALRLLFTAEAPEQCVETARAYTAHTPPPASFTRGLYYRDVE